MGRVLDRLIEEGYTVLVSPKDEDGNRCPLQTLEGVLYPPGNIGDADDISGGLAELDPKTQQAPAKPPTGVGCCFDTQTRLRLLVWVGRGDFNPLSGETSTRWFRQASAIRLRWISEDGKRWTRCVLVR